MRDVSYVWIILLLVLVVAIVGVFVLFSQLSQSEQTDLSGQAIKKTASLNVNTKASPSSEYEVFEEDYEPHIAFKEMSAKAKELYTLSTQIRVINEKKKKEQTVGKLDIATLKTKLSQRKQMMEEMLEADPDLVYFSLYPSEVLSQFPKEVKDFLETEIVMEANLEVIHIDDFERKTAKYQYALNSGAERFPFYPTQNAAVYAGAKVRVQGYKIGKKIIALTDQEHLKLLSPGQPLQAKGSKKVLVILLKFRDSPDETPFTKEQVGELMFDGHLNNLYKEMSYGKMSWTGDVIGWYTIPRRHECLPANFEGGALNDEVYKLIKNDVDIFQYGYVVMMSLAELSTPICDSGTFGSLGKMDFMISKNKRHSLSLTHVTLDPEGYFAFPYPYITPPDGNPLGTTWLDFALSHELGHNLGLLHANAWKCSSGKIRYGNCEHIEYGNYFDTMGHGLAASHFNAYYKDKLNWIDKTQVLTIKESGRYTLNPLETNFGKIIAKIEVPINNLRSLTPYSQNPTPYTLEYRRPIGYDFAINMIYGQVNQDSLLVNWVYDSPYENAHQKDTRLLDMTPAFQSNNIFDDLHNVALPFSTIKKGVFKDKGRGITIGPIISKSEEAITFDVKIETLECVRAEPSIDLLFVPTIFTDLLTLSEYTPSAYFTLMNTNSPTCGRGHYQVSFISPIGWIVNLVDENVITSLPESVATEFGEIIMQIPPTTRVGTYEIEMLVTQQEAPEKSVSVIIPVEIVQ